MTLHSFPFVSLVTVVAAVAATFCEAAPFPNQMCWKAKEVQVRFNPSLSAELENPTNAVPPFPSYGTGRDRLKAMEKAIADWNTALQSVGANLKLKLVETKKSWAGAQGRATCIDPSTPGNELVYRVDYANTHPNGRNVGSTAEDNQTRARNLGPGWIQGGNPETYAIDRRLAETVLTPLPNDPNGGPIREADIVWFTHLEEGRFCPPIRWGYVPSTPQNPGPTTAPYYDFYSVMLHEVGHLLGLDHESCPRANAAGNAGNVMEATIFPGTRTEILDCELRALKLLYGPGAPCRIN